MNFPILSTKKNVFSTIFWILLSAFSWYLSGVIGVIGTLLAFVIYGIIAYVGTILWRLLMRKPLPWFLTFLWYFAYRVALFFTIVAVIFGSFCIYQNELYPAYLPRYTITDGKKTVVFQTMAHIATDRFYDAIKDQIRSAKKSGFVLFFEWVRPGTEENMKKFDEAMGFVFDPSLYSNISRLYGLREQRNKEFLGIENNKDVNVDISIDDIIKLYEKRLSAESPKKVSARSPIDIAPLVDASLKSMTPHELAYITYMNRALMNFIMKNDTAQQAIITTAWQQDIFATILEDRNAHLANTIIESPEKNIFVLYGMLHFDGVFALLQKNSPDWRVERVEFEYPAK